jgi:competence ComEA-like helix-hairpin-helix protein
MILLIHVASYSTDYIPKEVDINKADTTVFMALPGIGSKLAARIVKYREQLHGFFSVEQVAETHGLADSTFRKIRKWLVVKDTTIQKININKATIEELKFPYINYNLANAIYQYRQQHGDYKNLQDLQKIVLVNDSLLNKLSPYLSLE